MRTQKKTRVIKVVVELTPAMTLFGQVFWKKHDLMCVRRKKNTPQNNSCNKDHTTLLNPISIS